MITCYDSNPTVKRWFANERPKLLSDSELFFANGVWIMYWFSGSDLFQIDIFRNFITFQEFFHPNKDIKPS